MGNANKEEENEEDDRGTAPHLSRSKMYVYETKKGNEMKRSEWRRVSGEVGSVLRGEVNL